jgi:hypothetical protein
MSTDIMQSLFIALLAFMIMRPMLTHHEEAA